VAAPVTTTVVAAAVIAVTSAIAMVLVVVVMALVTTVGWLRLLWGHEVHRLSAGTVLRAVARPVL
jgi:hypothetical protein